jgi:hypothetical protein
MLRDAGRWSGINTRRDFRAAQQDQPITSASGPNRHATLVARPTVQNTQVQVAVRSEAKDQGTVVCASLAVSTRLPCQPPPPSLAQGDLSRDTQFRHIGWSAGIARCQRRRISSALRPGRRPYALSDQSRRKPLTTATIAADRFQRAPNAPRRLQRQTARQRRSDPRNEALNGMHQRIHAC